MISSRPTSPHLRPISTLERFVDAASHSQAERDYRRVLCDALKTGQTELAWDASYKLGKLR